MATQTPALANQMFKMLPLGSIEPSPHNPRKSFDAKALDELADSIKAQGVRQPILVRPLDTREWQQRLEDDKPMKFEIVVGERRYRASKLAGQKAIPAMVAELTNAAALEIQVIENLQREDVHPLDEAAGYAALLNKTHCTECNGPLTPNGHSLDCPNHGKPTPETTVEDIAKKVGKSPSYIYQRLKLCSLHLVAADYLRAGVITAGHAILIARLGVSDQLFALTACTNRYASKAKKEEELRKELSEQDSTVYEDQYAMPEKALREWIQDNINLELKKATWKLDDATLVPEAGACTTCPKRSGNNLALFGDLVEKNSKDVCFDRDCFQRKAKALVQLEIEKFEGDDNENSLLKLSEDHSYTKAKPDAKILKQGQWKEAKPGSCPSVAKGVIVKGENVGAVKTVCAAPNCKKHPKTLYGEVEGSGGGQSYDHEGERFKRHRQDIAQLKRAAGRQPLAREIIKKVGASALPWEILRQAAFQIKPDVRRLAWLVGDAKLKSENECAAALNKAKGKELNALLAAAVLAKLLTDRFDTTDNAARADLVSIAKAFRLDGKKLLAQADKDIAAMRSCGQCGCTESVPCSVWDNGKQAHCSWKGERLCSNPDCVKRAAAKEEKTSAKAARTSGVTGDALCEVEGCTRGPLVGKKHCLRHEPKATKAKGKK